MSRVLIIGIDGATFDLIQPWAEAGDLPNLARLMAEGVHGLLESTLPPVTSPAWPTFATGKNPGKHSVFDFIRPMAASPHTGGAGGVAISNWSTPPPSAPRRCGRSSPRPADRSA